MENMEMMEMEPVTEVIENVTEHNGNILSALLGIGITIGGWEIGKRVVKFGVRKAKELHAKAKIKKLEAIPDTIEVPDPVDNLDEVK